MYPKSLTIAHLDENSVRNKFSSLQQSVLSKADMFLLSATKSDDSFPDFQFFAEYFEMFLKDGTKDRGGL